MPPSFASGIRVPDFPTEDTTASLYDQVSQDDPLPVGLFLTDFPLLYVLPQGLQNTQYSETISRLKWMNARIAKNVNHARLVLSYASGPSRVKHDLISERFANAADLRKPELKDNRSITLSFRSLKDDQQPESSQSTSATIRGTQSETDIGAIDEKLKRTVSHDVNDADTARPRLVMDPTKVLVIQLEWLYDSIKDEQLLPLSEYIILEGPWVPAERKNRTSGDAKRRKQSLSGDYTANKPEEYTDVHATSPHKQSNKRLLLSQETTEGSEAIQTRPTPEWVRNQIKYSCQRKQTQPSANEGFVDELRLIKHKRILDDKNEEKIRNSYGRAISSIAAYPYQLLSPSEVKKLPSCGEKFEKLFQEFVETGSLSEADEMRHDPRLQTLDTFWKIHGVGPHIAKALYDKGYRTLDGLRYKVWPQLEELFEDDPVEKRRLDHLADPGLDREQQQGLKYYDDFLERIPNEECENIASIITDHLVRLTDSRAQAMLVGSFRKGKPTSGDVDIVVSHPDESQTANLIDRLYDSLDSAGWIRAKLKISLAHTHRDQTPMIKSHRKPGASFASLDIALLVWQDKTWPSKAADLAADPDARNPATCRRVDIIVSPWKSVGCAVLGWSGGITFERDLREYAHAELNWKFDSSGVLDRRTGAWLDVEGYDNPETRATSIEQAERRVIEALKLQCFDPRERLTD